MSQLSQLYLDILEAISCLSMQKGTTQKEILNQIANQLGRPLTKKATEKAARTLNKLVEEGVLVKKGRRYMLPVIKTEKKKASGDNPVIEIKSESEDDESQNGWISSDEESPGPSKKKSIPVKKMKKLKAKDKCRKRKPKKPDQHSSESFSSGTERPDRSRSPIKIKSKCSTANNNPPDGENDGCEGPSKSEISVTSEGIMIEMNKKDDYRYESPNIPSPSNPQVLNIKRIQSCCSITCANQELEADRQDQILNKMKHERESYKIHLRRSPSKAKERQHKKKERDEFIEKGRIEKFNRNSYSPDGDGSDPRTSFHYSCDNKKV